MRCIAIDDEPIALSILTQYCRRIEGCEITTFNDPLVGIEQVQRTRPDLLFLDIEMGEISGVELARQVPRGVHIIFTTAYAKFAIDGFDIGVVDFLHKPFSYTRFERAVERSRELHELNRFNVTDNEEHIVVKVEYQNVSIPLSHILYIEAMDNYIRIYQYNMSRPTISQMSLKSVEEMLPEELFRRVHRSFIVSRRAIVSYTKSQIKMADQQSTIPVGRIYSDSFLEWVSATQK